MENLFETNQSACSPQRPGRPKGPSVPFTAAQATRETRGEGSEQPRLLRGARADPNRPCFALTAGLGAARAPLRSGTAPAGDGGFPRALSGPCEGTPGPRSRTSAAPQSQRGGRARPGPGGAEARPRDLTPAPRRPQRAARRRGPVPGAPLPHRGPAPPYRPCSLSALR